LGRYDWHAFSLVDGGITRHNAGLRKKQICDTHQKKRQKTSNDKLGNACIFTMIDHFRLLDFRLNEF